MDGPNCSVPASMESPAGSYPAEGTLDDVLGFELLEATPDGCRARFSVEDRVRQPLGLVHGGAYAALAESMVSATTALAVADDGNFAVGQSNHTTFMRPATDGHRPRFGRAPPPRAHHLGLGRELHRRRRTAVRRHARDDGGAAGALGGS